MGRLFFLGLIGLAGCGVNPDLYDRDGDGFGAIEGDCGITCRDCDDSDPDVHPEAIEVCNAVDDDCDGRVDADAADAGTWYADDDQDGFGGAEIVACEQPAGSLTEGTDCNDTDGDVSPAGEELCNGVDDDCNGEVDDDAADALEWFEDEDGDGFGASGAIPNLACGAPPGTAANDDDCDDGWEAVGPRECRRRLALGGDFSCATLEGVVECWGDDEYSVTSAPSTPMADLDGAQSTVCGKSGTGALSCWGRGDFGIAAPPAGEYSSFAHGGEWGCAADDSGVVSCFGDDVLANGAVPANTLFSSLSAQGGTLCGVTVAGDVHCWAPTNENASTHNQGGPFEQVAVGSGIACAIDGAASMQCFQPTGEALPAAWAPPLASGILDVACDSDHCCLLDGAGQAMCWSGYLSPLSPPSGTFTDIDVGASHACAITTDDEIICWGDDSYGQSTPPT